MLTIAFVVLCAVIGVYFAFGAAVAATRTPDQEELIDQIKAIFYTMFHWPSVLRGRSKYGK